MTELLLYPRLPVAVARSKIAEIKGRSLADLSRMAAFEFPQAIYPATGGTRVLQDVLKSTRSELLRKAEELGFPQRTEADPIHFDWAAAPVLLKTLRMTPGEACRNDVWTFIATVVLPDLVAWRFPSRHETRYLGGGRNTLQRLWWRAYLLREKDSPDPWRLVRLPEDALVGLMERPGISSNPRVTQAIARWVADSIVPLKTDGKEDLWRRAYRLVRQRIPLVNLDALEESDLVAQINEVCRIAVKRTGSQ